MTWHCRLLVHNHQNALQGVCRLGFAPATLVTTNRQMHASGHHLAVNDCRARDLALPGLLFSHDVHML